MQEKRPPEDQTEAQHPPRWAPLTLLALTSPALVLSIGGQWRPRFPSKESYCACSRGSFSRPLAKRFGVPSAVAEGEVGAGKAEVFRREEIGLVFNRFKVCLLSKLKSMSGNEKDVFERGDIISGASEGFPVLARELGEWGRRHFGGFQTRLRAKEAYLGASAKRKVSAQ